MNIVLMRRFNRMASRSSGCSQHLSGRLLGLLVGVGLTSLLMFGLSLVWLLYHNQLASPLIWLGLSGAGLVSLALLTRLIIRQIVQPLEQLQHGLEQLEQSDLMYRLDFAGETELGQLAAAFNRLAEQLGQQRSQRQLQVNTLNAKLAETERQRALLQQAYASQRRHNQLLVQVLGIGHMLQRNLNPNSLFQELVQTIHYALGFEVVILSLLDETSQQLRVRAYVGIDEAERQYWEEAVYAWEDFVILLQDRFRIGRCYFFPNNGAGNDDLAEFTPADLERKWHPDDSLLVPIELRPGQVVGIFSLGQPMDGRRPDLETLQSLEVFASQTATAIENARLYNQVQQDLVDRQRVTEELRQLNDQLENRVRERTAELAQANEVLQIQILERQRAEEQIMASLKEKEMLLQEIHHRVKNNLQVISSLLSLQAGYIESEEIQEIFKDSQHRVRSMALVHEKLYRSEDLARIDLAEYIRNLATFLFGSYRANAGRISLAVQADDVFLGIDAAVPCGLMLNELISNALKHAFPNGRSGQLWVELHQDSDRQVRLIVRDNGTGLPPGFDIFETDSLGMQLVGTLVDQLNGTLEIHSEGGTEFIITFPLVLKN